LPVPRRALPSLLQKNASSAARFAPGNTPCPPFPASDYQ
jgi:hypothetical protein